jgi:hypothetical protein
MFSARVARLVAGKVGYKSAAKKKAAPITAASTVTVDVYNGGSTAGLADGVSQALVSLGYKKGAVADASTQSQTPVTGTEVFYGAGASANAANAKYGIPCVY